MEDEAAAWCGRVDLLGQHLEADLTRLQVGGRLHELVDRSRETVKLPDHEGIAGAEVIERRFQLRSITAGAGGRLGEDAITPRRGERLKLEGGGLVPGGNPR